MNSIAQKIYILTHEIKKSQKARENNVYIPIPVEPISIQTKPLLDNLILAFKPKFRVSYQSIRSAMPVNDYLQLFLYLFSELNLVLIIAFTNSKTNLYTPTLPSLCLRLQKSLTRNKLIVQISMLFYIGRYYETNKKDYQKPNIYHLKKHILKIYQEQIHKYLTINIDERLLEQLQYYKLKSLTLVIHLNLQKACYLVLQLIVDEIIIKFIGRSRDTTKILKKSIKKGFKIQCLGFKRYIYLFKYYLEKDFSEGISKLVQYN